MAGWKIRVFFSMYFHDLLQYHTNYRGKSAVPADIFFCCFSALLASFAFHGCRQYGKLILRFPEFRNRLSSAAPFHSALNPSFPSCYDCDPFVIIVHSILEAAARTDFIRSAARWGARRLFQFRVSADKAGGHGMGALKVTLGVSIWWASPAAVRNNRDRRA